MAEEEDEERLELGCWCDSAEVLLLLLGVCCVLCGCAFAAADWSGKRRQHCGCCWNC